jgi:hypothetical protein
VQLSSISSKPVSRPRSEICRIFLGSILSTWPLCIISFPSDIPFHIMELPDFQSDLTPYPIAQCLVNLAQSSHSILQKVWLLDPQSYAPLVSW